MQCTLHMQRWYEKLFVQFYQWYSTTTTNIMNNPCHVSYMHTIFATICCLKRLQPVLVSVFLLFWTWCSKQIGMSTNVKTLFKYLLIIVKGLWCKICIAIITYIFTNITSITIFIGLKATSIVNHFASICIFSRIYE